MKKYLIVIFAILMSIMSLAEYNYPFQNPNMATIIGSSTLMMEGVTPKINKKSIR